MEWLYTYQKRYILESPTNAITEIKGIVDGICSTDDFKDHADCKNGKFLKYAVGVNEIPDLVRMACSMMGAWGGATAKGDLIQYRTLDFGGGPFANVTFLHVAHPTDSDFPFATFTFPGFAGAVTGFTKNIALSEIGYCLPGDKQVPGTYNGEGDGFVIRDILQLAHSSKEAVEIAHQKKRTWAIFLGFGDYNTQDFDLIVYDKAEVRSLDPQTTPDITGQKVIENVAYIDKHCQPST
jgi:hypothetical protein